MENGRAWEADFRSRESAKPTSKFAFLHPANCYNAYCEWRIAPRDCVTSHPTGGGVGRGGFPEAGVAL